MQGVNNSHHSTKKNYLTSCLGFPFKVVKVPLFKLKWEVAFFFSRNGDLLGVYDLGCPGNVGSWESEGSVSYYLG